MSRRCFVVSPIGSHDSAVREHADDVFEFIIKPAMDELGIHAYRSDHSQMIGRITDQMFESLLSDDLCIAVLTFHNPNVFYELAIAQCAARPVIMMIEHGQVIPFDIRDLRAITYDLKPRSIRDKLYVKQIIEHVRNLEAVDWVVDVPFGDHLEPLGCRKELLRVHDRVECFGTSDRWLELIRGTVTRLDMSGLTLRWWTKIAAFRSLLVEKAEAGCEIRILLTDPNNSVVEQYNNSLIRAQSHNRLSDEIAGSLAFFMQLSQSHSRIQIRQITRGCLHQQILRTDDRMMVNLMLYSESTAQSPMLECASESQMFMTIANEFQTLWNLNPSGAFL